MRKSRFSKTAYLLFIFVLFISNSNCLFAKEGIAIILYGTPSAGKTTLAKELVDKLPGNFQMLKKTEYVETKTKEFIYQTTGKKVSSRIDMIEAVEALPHDLRIQTNKFTKEGIYVTLQKIEDITARGENVIFDVCLSGVENLKPLNCKNTLTVLVYAPLKTVSDREIPRAKKNNDSLAVLQKRRNAILCMFTGLYQPKKVDSDNYIDILTKDDLEEFFLAAGKKLQVTRLKTTYEKALKKYEFDVYKKRKIYAIPQHDLLLNTGNNSALECAMKVKRALKERNLL